tara:strand:+ start:457 stop:1413 length:957 start_codon:yes stop_codon:yes gene_type:complete
MAYGSTISRGVLGDPSAQARGRRLGVTDEDRKEKKQKKQKPPKDVPLRKWKSHRKALGDMKDSLKDLKKQIRDADDPTEKAKLQMRWEAGFDEYDVTKKQLQQVRNEYQASWESQVELMEEDVDGVQRTDKRRFLNRYTDGVDTYNDLRENSISLDSWEPGTGAPKFNWLEQQLNEGETVNTADGKVEQWTFKNPRLGEPMTLDKIPTVIDPKAFKFYEQSFTSSDGKVEIGGMTEFDPPADLEAEARAQGAADKEFFEKSKRLAEGAAGRYAFAQSQRALSGDITQAQAVQNVNENMEYGGTTTKRKKYDIDGNRIE